MTTPILQRLPKLKQLALNTIPDIQQIIKLLERLETTVFYEPECREDYLTDLKGTDERIKEDIDKNLIPYDSIKAFFYGKRAIVKELRAIADEIEAHISPELFMDHYFNLEDHLAAKKREKDLAEQNKS